MERKEEIEDSAEKNTLANKRLRECSGQHCSRQTATGDRSENTTNCSKQMANGDNSEKTGNCTNQKAY